MNLVYQPATGQTPAQLALSGGTVELKVGSGFDMSLTLGTPGLIVENNSLVSLAASASVSNATLAGATFAATGLGLTYVSATDSFTGYGSATLTLAKSTNALTLTLGTETDPGLTISQDAVTGLNATANFSMTLAGATFSAQERQRRLRARVVVGVGLGHGRARRR